MKSSVFKLAFLLSISLLFACASAGRHPDSIERSKMVCAFNGTPVYEGDPANVRLTDNNRIVISDRRGEITLIGAQCYILKARIPLSALFAPGEQEEQQAPSRESERL